MIYILLGIIGAIFVLCAFIMGVLFGRYLLNKTPEQEEMTEEQKEEVKQLKLDQDAFLTQLSYNADVAYGLRK